MFIEERHQAILDIIAERGSITTSIIQRKFGVSYDSAKRDLRILEEKGLLKRTHGGAIEVGELSIGKPRRRLSSQVSERALEAAKRGLEHIKNGSVIFVPHGEIGYALSILLSEDRVFTSLRVITNSPRNAEIISANVNIRVIMVGGELTDGEARDGFAVSMMSRFRIDTAFIEAEHFSEDFGLSCDDSTCCAFFEGLIGVSRSIVLLLSENSRKGDGAISVCAADKIDVVI